MGPLYVLGWCCVAWAVSLLLPATAQIDNGSAAFLIGAVGVACFAIAYRRRGWRPPPSDLPAGGGTTTPLWAETPLGPRPSTPFRDALRTVSNRMDGLVGWHSAGAAAAIVAAVAILAIWLAVAFL